MIIRPHTAKIFGQIATALSLLQTLSSSVDDKSIRNGGRNPLSCSCSPGGKPVVPETIAIRINQSSNGLRVVFRLDSHSSHWENVRMGRKGNSSFLGHRNYRRKLHQSTNEQSATATALFHSRADCECFDFVHFKLIFKHLIVDRFKSAVPYSVEQFLRIFPSFYFLLYSSYFTTLPLRLEPSVRQTSFQLLTQHEQHLSWFRCSYLEFYRSRTSAHRKRKIKASKSTSTFRF